MIGLIIGLCHFFGTAYYILGDIELSYEVEGNWISELCIVEGAWYVKYFESFYWALATFLLVGSKGFTIYETIFVINVLLITICAFAYIL